MTEEKKTLAQTVIDYRTKHDLNMNVFGLQAGVHFATIKKAEEGEYDKDYSAATGPKKTGAARAITNLAKACGKDPTVFLKAAGLSDVVPAYGPKMGEAREKIGAIFNMSIGKEDLEYLLTVSAGLQQPLNLGMVVELLKRRQSSPSD